MFTITTNVPHGLAVNQNVWLTQPGRAGPTGVGIVTAIVNTTRFRMNLLKGAGPAVGGFVQTCEHRSDQGWGVWEVNPKLVLNFDATEWRNLLLGSDGQLTAPLAGPLTIAARTRGRRRCVRPGAMGIERPLP